MSEVALQIWSMPELGYLETKTSALLQDELKKAGFEIEIGVAGIPTAFVARAGTSDGPVIAILAEIDALPGLSQGATPERAPIANQDAGHACGHHLFGAGAVAAAIAVKTWLAETGTKGRIRVYGTPAEEGGGGKVYMVRAGLFKNVDVTLYWHRATPATPRRTRTSPTRARNSASRSGRACGGGADRGRSALDGVGHELWSATCASTCRRTRIHYVITNGGAAPNVVPEFAESYCVRHPGRVVAGCSSASPG